MPRCSKRVQSFQASRKLNTKLASYLLDTHIRFLVTGADVIHDFAMPSLGLKVDAFPGRLNQTSVLIEREGVFYGQCSEIFGVYHGFMPAVIEAVTPEKSFLSR
nr:hypothetical protein [Solanum melongena]